MWVTPVASASSMLNKFCRPEMATLQFDTGSLPYSRADVHLEHYSPSLFEQAAIPMPASVGRSVPKRQADYLAGRLCARRAMEIWGYAGEPMAGHSGCPVWPRGLRGSISHSARHAVALALPAMDCGGLGIDTELVASGRASEALLRHAVLAEEHAALEFLSTDMGRDAAITVIFSAKESFYKAAFEQVGAYFGFEALALQRVRLDAKRMEFSVTRTLAPQLRKGKSISIGFEVTAMGSVLTYLALERVPA